MVTAVGTIPRSFHYFSTGQGEGYRILVFDEDRAVPPVVVLTSGRLTVPAGPDVRSEAFSASADGTVVVIMRRLSELETTYFVLRPESGAIRTLLSAPDLGPPMVSADGSRIAYARTSQDPALHGLWVASIAAGAPVPTRLVSDNPQRVSSPPIPVAWSPDGKWLAIGLGQSDSGYAIAVMDPTAGEAHYDAAANPPVLIGGRGRTLGPGFAVDWRGGERALLITSSRTAFGGRTEIYTADVTTGVTRSLYKPTSDVRLGTAVMHPSLDRYAFQESPFGRGPGAPNTMWVRRLDGTATKIGESGFNSDPWWSRDGTKLFSITGGDDSTGSISNLLGTGGGTIFCRRGGAIPPCL
jgi:Tol biopolymer transport system component